jgi:hypothetical protein
MKASKAREITDNHEHYNAEKWYLEYKYQLFDRIKSTALLGNHSIPIFTEEWGKNETKQKYLLFNLESLGYKVNANQNGIITISW